MGRLTIGAELDAVLNVLLGSNYNATTECDAFGEYVVFDVDGRKMFCKYAYLSEKKLEVQYFDGKFVGCHYDEDLNLTEGWALQTLEEIDYLYSREGFE